MRRDGRRRQDLGIWIAINTMLKSLEIRIILTKGTLKEQSEKLGKKWIHESWGKSKSRGWRVCSVVNDIVPLPEDPNSILSIHVRPFKTAWYPYSREFDTFLCFLQSPTNIYTYTTKNKS